MAEQVEKVRMSLIGVDGNAFAIMGKFKREARRQGWSKEKIAEVLEEAMREDYDHLLFTISSHIEEDDPTEDEMEPHDVYP